MKIRDLQVGEEVQTDDWMISPSQIKTIQRGKKDAEGCDRKWGFVYIEGLRGPSTPAAQLGTETHAILETYYRTGELPDTSVKAGKLASVGLETLPSRDKLFEFEDSTMVESMVEAHLSFVHAGVHYRGFADLLWTEPRCPECGDLVFESASGSTCMRGHGGLVPDVIPTVADHKTSSDPERWGLTSDTIKTDPQALVYATAALAWTGAPSVDLQWNYLRTRGKIEAVPVRTSLSRRAVFRAFETHVSPHGKRILSLVQAHSRGEITKAEDLTPNPLACGAFGGCPHASYCTRSAAAIMTSIFGEQGPSTMKLKDKLAAKHKSEGKPAKEGTSGKKKDKDGKKKKDKKKDKDGKRRAEGDTAVAPMKRDKKGKNKDKDKDKDKGKGRTINSPEAPKSPEIAREISKVVGQAGGSKKNKKDKDRAIAAAAAGATTPESAAERAGKALDRLGRDKLSPADQVLVQVSSGLVRFAPTKSVSADLGVPFAAGRTIMAMKRAEQIEVTKGEEGTYTIKILQAGLDRLAELDDVSPFPKTLAAKKTGKIDVDALAAKLASVIAEAMSSAGVGA